MKNQIHLSSRSKARRGNPRSIIYPRRGTWLGLLLAGFYVVLTGFLHPTRAAVTEAWVQRYNNLVSNSTDRASKVVRDAAGDIILTGTSGSAMLTLKYSGADGSVLWQKRYTNAIAQAAAVDGNGNVLVTGYSATVKYSAVDGALLWEQYYNGPGNGDARAQAMALDGSGNVVVTGYSHNGTNNDYYSAKYSAADGTLLWEKRYNGPANGDDYVSSLALGPNGMVAITGSSSGDYATVVYQENLPPLSIALVSTGVRLRFTGVPGLSYKIERAAAVTGPWTTINTQTAPASGLLEYFDAPAPSGQAFYRTVQP